MCSNGCSNGDVRHDPKGAISVQRPAATTPIDRREPSLQPGIHRVIIAAVIRHVASNLLSDDRSPTPTERH
jgi:hypothetical protein